MEILKSLKRNLINMPGWRTTKKIVVIESDDWGSISMPSIDVYNKFLKEGIPVDKSYFSKYDSLENEDDLNELFNILSKYKDCNGNHPCITACTIVANPDFEKIKNSNFENYYFEPFVETYKKYPNHAKTFEIWKKGIEEKLLWPQFHGREHLNPNEWLKSIKSGNHFEKLAFDNHAILAVTDQISSKRFMGYLAAFDYETIQELKQFENVIREGQELFEAIFGYKSTSFVAPTGIRSDELDQYLSKYGIKYHQLGQQFLPYAEARYAIRNRVIGSSNKYGQFYWRRNGTFEPSQDNSFNWVSKVIEEMKLAFRYNKPFVISSHRVNYIGGIFKENRENTLKQLNSLIKLMLQTYPNLEFMSSDQLGDEIAANPNYFLGINPKSFFYDVKYYPPTK